MNNQQSILFAHRTLLRAGLALVSVFSWIFVFQFSLARSESTASAFIVALAVYAISQFVLLCLTPLSASHLRHGVNRAMIFGACLAAFAFVLLGGTLAGYFDEPVGWGLFLFGIFMGAYRAVYWIPYRLQSAGMQKDPNALFEILLALLPAFAGVTLALQSATLETMFTSPLRLLFGAALLVMLSLIPIFFLKDTHERFEWRYTETFTKLFDTRYRTLSLRSTLTGIENAALFLIWPLSVFLIVGSSYVIFGFVMTASLIILLIARALYRRLFHFDVSKSPIPLDVVFAVSGWVLRLAAGSPIMIVVADSYSYVSAPAASPEFIAHEHAPDAGSYIDEYTALQETGMAFGRILMCLFAGAFILIAPLSIAIAMSLVVAGISAGTSAALSHRSRVEAY